MAWDTLPARVQTPARVVLTDANQQTLVAAPGAGKHLVVYGLFGSNAGASLSAVDVKDGSTARFTFAVGANGGGFACPLSTGWHLASNSALTVQQSAAVTSYVTALYDTVFD